MSSTVIIKREALQNNFYSDCKNDLLKKTQKAKFYSNLLQIAAWSRPYTARSQKDRDWRRIPGGKDIDACFGLEAQ